jgi:hypothetical protein
LICCRNEKIVDINTDNAIGFIEDAVVGLRHGEAVGSQDAVDALVPNPRGLLEAIQGASEPTHILALRSLRANPYKWRNQRRHAGMQ